MPDEKVTAASRWAALDGKRTGHLNRARTCAALTIPHLLPPAGTDYNTELPTPYQSHGARCVNNLSSKLWLTLFPPNNVFFRLSMSQKVLKELEAMAQEGAAIKSDIERSFGEIEKTALQFLETRGMRSPAFKALRHLVVTGNVLVYVPPAKNDLHPWYNPGAGMKIFRLDQYVVVRDPMGNLLEIVIKEPVSLSVLPEEIQGRVSQSQTAKPEEKVDLFTRIHFENGLFHVEQSVQNEVLPDSEGTYAPDRLPWIALRWTEEDDYGRGHVEEYLGDFYSLEQLSQALTEGGNAMAKVIFLNNPNGMTRSTDLVRAKNLDVISGRKDDVQCLQVDKFAEFQAVEIRIQALEMRLSHAFLLNSAIQRQAERVTAEEVRFMAQELEDALGGQYSVMSQEFQLPVVKLTIIALEDTGEIPQLPKQDVRPVITTGLEALGRTREQSKIVAWLQDCNAVLTPQVVIPRINPGEYMKRSATNYGVDTKDLVVPEEQVQAQQRADQLNAVAGSMAPDLAKGVMNYAKANQEAHGGESP